MIGIFLADGFEEIEALVPLDILRRASVNVKLIGVGVNQVKGTNGVTVQCDISEKDLVKDDFDGIILPGGMPGAENLYKSTKVKEVIKYCVDNNKLIGAICAAPLILGRLGILIGKKACCYPGFEHELKDAVISQDSICVDGNIITAKGPGVSMEFAFKLLNALIEGDMSNKIKRSMQCEGY